MDQQTFDMLRKIDTAIQHIATQQEALLSYYSEMLQHVDARLTAVEDGTVAVADAVERLGESVERVATGCQLLLDDRLGKDIDIERARSLAPLNGNFHG